MLRPVWRLPSEPAWSAPGRRCCARFPVRWPAVRVVPGAPRAQLAYCGDGVANHLHAIRDRLTGSALGIWSTGWRTPPRCERWPDVAKPRPARVGAALGRTESSPTVARQQRPWCDVATEPDHLFHRYDVEISCASGSYPSPIPGRACDQACSASPASVTHHC
jgi:hypothetical protein